MPAGMMMASPTCRRRRFAPDAHFGLTIQDVHQGVERRGMLTELLAGVKGEERDVASVGLRDLAADDRTLLIGRQVKPAAGLRPRECSSFEPLSARLLDLDAYSCRQASEALSASHQQHGTLARVQRNGDGGGLVIGDRDVLARWCRRCRT